MQPAPDIALAAFGLQYAAGGRQIIRGATLEIRRGETYLLLASGGAGKTTLLKLCTGILVPDLGSVYVDGRDLNRLSPEGKRELRMRLRFVFEDGVLLSNMSLLENISLPLMYHTHLDRHSIRQRVREEMSHLRILEYAAEMPPSVDRSVRRRAHVAMALILKPEILVVDSPLAGFDVDIANLVLSRIRRLKEETGLTLILASHTLESLSKFTDTIGILEGGKIVHSGTLGKIVEMLKSMEDSRLGVLE